MRAIDGGKSGRRPVGRAKANGGRAKAIGGKPLPPESALGQHRLLRSCFFPAPKDVTEDHLRLNIAQLRRAVDAGAIEFDPPKQAIYEAIVDAYADGVPDLQLLTDKFENDVILFDTLNNVVGLGGPDFRIRTNYAHLVAQEAEGQRWIRFVAALKEAKDLGPEKGLEHLLQRRSDFDKGYSLDKPTAEDPLRGLAALGPIAVRGRERILELASKPIEYVWDKIAERGLTCVLGAAPGGGKTSLLFWLIAARANLGEPVKVLGQLVTPAPKAQNVLIVEEEHQEESTSRLLVNACRRSKVDDSCLDRVIFVSRKGVQIGNPIWEDIVSMISAGLVSDVVLDTLARVGPGDSNDEQAQVAIFNAITAAIQSAPTPKERPVFWVAAHVRKSGEGIPTMQDISGSAQRVGASDVVITMAAKRTDGGTVDSVRVAFPKVREQDAEDSLPLVQYRMTREGYEIVGGTPESSELLTDRIEAMLKTEHLSKADLRARTDRSAADVDKAIDVLFRLRKIRYGNPKMVRGKECRTFTLRMAHDDSEDVSL